MCGIAGRFNYDPLRPVGRGVLEAMTDAVAHRGPDAAGYHLAPGIGLGHRRLSIIDLSTGDQPLANENGTIWTVFNGEIYNFAEVRAELKSLLEDPDVPRDWRPDAIDAYLTLLYIPAPATIYKGVYKLEPGHVLVAEKGSIRTSRYWDLQFTGDGDAIREEEYL